MGKVKKKKFSAPKPRPTGLPSVGECEAEIELQGEDVHSATLQTIVEKLQSPNEENRECACTAIAGLASHPGTLAAFLKLNVIKILGPLVLDHSWDIRHRALGALRNLSVDGEVTVCEEMVAKDVLTPVLALVQQFGSGDQFSEKETQRRKTMICETYAHAFYLLQNLCENCTQAVTTFSNGQLIPVICTILDSECSTEDLKLAVVEFLYTVTEDNTAMCRPDLVECVHRIMSKSTDSSTRVLMKTLASGVLVNLEGSRLTTARGDLVVPIVTTMSDVLAVNVAAMLTVQDNDMTDTPATTDTSDVNAGTETDTDKDVLKQNNAATLEEKRLCDIKNLLKAQKVALEVVANLCCSDDEEWEDLNSSESSTEESAETPMEEDITEGDSSVVPLCVSTELHTAYVSCGIVEKVLEAAQPLAAEQLLILQENKSLLERFQSKQTHALLCLNNLVSSLDTEALGGCQKLYTVWQGLLQLSTSQKSIEEEEVLEAVTAAMRAVIQKLAEADPSKFQAVQPVDLQFMYEMSTKCQWPEVRVNAIRIVSTIGGILAQNPNPHPLLKDIGVLLLEVVCKDSGFMEW
ncbi:HEAT repeat-containing protein 3-like [Mercenaria mercenaria]|uniref:HEAT repeat-containing protein 3-like n=1 Tax=Mercenaria mercenaria TaxID=6596 RepID=UPI00234E4898|nr:HEAT repeat-containing protein 3-like [Mercenaria mercenaria]